MAYRLTYKGATVLGPGGGRLGAPTPTVTPISITASLLNVSTTGSMSAGSTILTVADATNLNPGDPIAVLCDGAAGLGAPGTRGVGGEWPLIRYATEAAVLADTSKAQNTYVWAEDTGLVYQWNPDWGAGGPYEDNWYTLQSSDYFFYRATPRALLTTIVEKSGTTLTLNHAAQVAVTDATVVYDNRDRLEEAIGQAGAGGTLTIPAGTWPVCSGATVRAAGVTITGEDFVAGEPVSKLTSPKGTPGASIVGLANVADDAHVTKLWMIGNCRDDGGWDFYRTSSSTTTLPAQPQLVQFTSADRLEVSYCWFTDPFSQAVQWQYCYQTHVHHNKIMRDKGYRTYTQWMIDGVDSSEDLIEYNEVDCDESIAAIECFRCNDSIMRFNTTRNGLYSLNACGNYTFEDNTCTVEANSRGTSHVTIFQALVVSINVSPPASKYNDGGYVRRFTVNVEGVTYSDPDLGRPKGINDSATPNCRCEDVVITFAPGFAGRGIQLSGAGASLTRCEVYGDDSGSFHTGQGANMYNVNGPAVDCIARSTPVSGTGGSIDAKAAGSSGNVAEYITLR